MEPRSLRPLSPPIRPRRLPEGFDAVRLNGHDPLAEHRRRVRERNNVRQEWEGWLERHPPQLA